MRSVFRLLVAAGLLCAAFQPARAQLVDAYLGLGIAHDGSNHEQFDAFGDGVLHPTGSLTGFFADLGAGVMIGRNLGAAFDVSWRGPQAVYTGIHYRPRFYSFDGIYQPSWLTRKRFAPEVRVGVGGAGLNFNPNEQQNCVNGPACNDSTHFQIHFAAAGRWYITDHLFVRPAFDVHAVHQFTEFSSNIVTEYTVGIGYSIGRE